MCMSIWPNWFSSPAKLPPEEETCGAIQGSPGNPACSPQVADLRLTPQHPVPKPTRSCDSAVGKARFTLTGIDPHGTATLRWHVKWTSLSSDIPAFPGITLNEGIPGRNGPVMLSLSNIWFAAVAFPVGYGSDDGNPFSSRVYKRLFLPSTGQISGSFEIPPDYVSELLKGKWYVAIHTEHNRDGELRGQLIF